MRCASTGQPRCECATADAARATWHRQQQWSAWDLQQAGNTRRQQQQRQGQQDYRKEWTFSQRLHPPWLRSVLCSFPCVLCGLLRTVFAALFSSVTHRVSTTITCFATTLCLISLLRVLHLHKDPYKSSTALRCLSLQTWLTFMRESTISMLCLLYIL